MCIFVCSVMGYDLISWSESWGIVAATRRTLGTPERMNLLVQLHPLARSTNFTSRSRQQSRPTPEQVLSSISSLNIRKNALMNSIVDESRKTHQPWRRAEPSSRLPKLKGTFEGFWIFRRFSRSHTDMIMLWTSTAALAGISLSGMDKQRPISGRPSLVYTHSAWKEEYWWRTGPDVYLLRVCTSFSSAKRALVVYRGSSFVPFFEEMLGIAVTLCRRWVSLQHRHPPERWPEDCSRPGAEIELSGFDQSRSPTVSCWFDADWIVSNICWIWETNWFCCVC